MSAPSPRAVAAYIGLGSNLGDREAAIGEALGRLAALGTVRDVSSLYETPPWGYEHQPAFLNAVCRLDTFLPALELLRGLKEVERAMGRQPTFRYGPRLIDLDLLLYGDAVLRTPELEVPHPGLPERPFVLVPLAELAPGLVHPTLGRSMAELARGVPGRERVRRWEGRTPPSPGHLEGRSSAG